MAIVLIGRADRLTDRLMRMKCPLTDMPNDLYARLIDGLAARLTAVVNFHDSLPLMWMMGRTSP
jgi:hypothetical protein